MLIVDGHAYAYRSFHAIRSLNSPSGAPTNAIFGFIKALSRMRAQLSPSHVAVVWDGGLHPERMEQHPAYKAQRPPMPDSLDAQITGLTGWLQAAGLPSFCHDGVEADDWIAVLARRHAGALPVVIASADKDFMQLVSPRVGLLNPNDKSEKLWTAEDVRAKTGVAPEQIVDWLSLIGDSVDNIPGVPGVGPKTATDLLGQFGTIAALYARLGEVKSDRIRAALQAAESDVRRNQRLIHLRDDVPPVALDELSPRPPDRERLRGLYSEWGFRGLLAELSDAPAPTAEQGALW
jgi:DNA polymerase-1